MSNLSNVCLSIRSSCRASSEKKGYASNGKMLISYTVKNGLNTLKAYPKKVPEYLLMDEKEYNAYGKAVQYVYNTACNLNKSKSKGESAAIIKVYTDNFYECLNELAIIVFGDTFKMAEASDLGGKILSMAEAYLPNMDGDYNSSNLPINKFVKALEPMLEAVAAQTVYLEDYQRDYNLAEKRCKARLAKANSQLSNAQNALDDAQKELDKCKAQCEKDASDNTIKDATKEKHNKAMLSAQTVYDEKKAIVDTIKNTISSWNIKLEEARKTFEEADKAFKASSNKVAA